MLIEAPMALASMSGRIGLDHFQARDEIGRHRVHRDASRAELGRRADDLAVDGDVVQAGVDAADDDEAAFTLIDFHRHAGNPAQRFRRIGIGEPAHRVGRDDVHDVRGRALLVARQRGAGAYGELFGNARDLEPESRRCSSPVIVTSVFEASRNPEIVTVTRYGPPGLSPRRGSSRRPADRHARAPSGRE